MNKIKITNKTLQAIPILLRDPENPKRLVQDMLRASGTKIILPGELSPHVESLESKKLITVETLQGREGKRGMLTAARNHQPQARSASNEPSETKKDAAVPAKKKGRK